MKQQSKRTIINVLLVFFIAAGIALSGFSYVKGNGNPIGFVCSGFTLVLAFFFSRYDKKMKKKEQDEAFEQNRSEFQNKISIHGNIDQMITERQIKIEELEAELENNSDEREKKVLQKQIEKIQNETIGLVEEKRRLL